MPANDLIFQQLSTVQSDHQPTPPTSASAATFVPTIPHFITFITGTTQITNIPPQVSGAHLLILIFTNGAPGGCGTGGATPGAFQTALTATQNVPVLLFYDPLTQKYWGGVLKTS